MEVAKHSEQPLRVSEDRQRRGQLVQLLIEQLASVRAQIVDEGPITSIAWLVAKSSIILVSWSTR